MKIEVERDLFTPASMRVSGGSKKTPQPNITDAAVINNVSQTLSRDKDLVDALIIAQMSRDFMQKAILISSRLRSISMETMLSGNLKHSAVSETLSDVNSTLSQMNEVYAPAAAFSGLDSVNKKYNTDFKLPDISTDMEAVKNVLKDFSSDENTRKSVDELLNTFEKQAKTLNKDIQSMKNLLNVKDSFEGNTDNDISAIVQNTEKRILSRSSEAFFSQGNLSSERVKDLFLEKKL